MAPKYAINGNFLVKSNVYNFENLLLEILFGMKSRGKYCPKESLNLIGYVSMKKLYPFIFVI